MRRNNTNLLKFPNYWENICRNVCNDEMEILSSAILKKFFLVELEDF